MILGEFWKNPWGKVRLFWDLGKSSKKLNSALAVAIWDGEMLTTWREAFLNVKWIRTQLKGIVSHDEGELHANYTKMSQFVHKFRERIAMNLS